MPHRRASLPPPRAFRSDALGIFLVLAVAGAAQVTDGAGGSLRQAVEGQVALAWGWAQVVGGTIGVLALVTPDRWGPQASVAQMVARVVLACGSLAYAVAVGAALGWRGPALGVVMTYLLIAGMCLVAADSIRRWLVAQQRAVRVLLTRQGSA